jgi:hypothetical protein
MRALLDAVGKVVAVGESDSLVPPEGGRVVELANGAGDAVLAQLGALGADEELTHDGKAFATRARPLTPQEAAQKAARAVVVPIAQSAVGVRFDALTPAQTRALVALLLYQQGALDGTGVVQPLSGWMRD